MDKQIPRGNENLVCPWHRCACSKVCHKCPLWIQVRGTNPNTGESVDNWSCSLAILPMLTIEVAQQARQSGAATESLRNMIAGGIARSGPKLTGANAPQQLTIIED